MIVCRNLFVYTGPSLVIGDIFTDILIYVGPLGLAWDLAKLLSLHCRGEATQEFLEIGLLCGGSLTGNLG